MRPLRELDRLNLRRPDPRDDFRSSFDLETPQWPVTVARITEDTMPMIRFNDGVTFETAGSFRFDSYYVVGQGTLGAGGGSGGGRTGY
jgi:hypothetical protein